MQNIIHAGKISSSAIDGIVQDVIQDIDRRVNHGGRNDKPTFFQDEDDEIDEDKENVLNQYCFEDLYGPNFGFRSLLEYEKECEEDSDIGRRCQEGLDEFSDDDNNLDDEGFELEPIDGKISNTYDIDYLQCNTSNDSRKV